MVLEVRRVGLHHVDIVVTSLERSLPLYRELLEPLGYTYADTALGERGETIWYLDGEGVGASLGIREAQTAGSGEVGRYAVGLHHIAFEASSRGMVDERFQWARKQGPRDRERTAGVAVRSRVLRDVLPGSGRHQARGRVRPVVVGAGLAQPLQVELVELLGNVRIPADPLSRVTDCFGKLVAEHDDTEPLARLVPDPGARRLELGEGTAKLLDRRIRVEQAPDQDANEHVVR